MRILLVQLADIGDLVLTTPALHALRHALPAAHLTLLTSAHAARILAPGLVDECLTLDRRATNSSLAFFAPRTLRRVLALRQTPFDAIVFFHHFTLALGTLKFALLAWASGAPRRLGLDNGKGWFLSESLPDEGFGARHQAQYWLDLVGLLGADSTPARAHVATDGGVLPIAVTTRKRIVLHSGSGGYSPARRWLPEYFAAVADALHDRYDAQIVLVGTPEDGTDAVRVRMTSQPVDLTGKTTLTQLADVLRSADLFIGADSGVMHLAAAVRTPTIALFGSSNARAWGAWSPQGAVALLQSNVLCSPCSYVAHSIGARNGCAARTCMKTLTPAQVLAAADALLAEQPAPEPPPPAAPPRRANCAFLGVGHHALTLAEWQQACEEAVVSAHPQLFVLSNHRLLLMQRRHSILKTLLGRVHVLLPCDGGLWWAANWQHTELPERITRPQAAAALLAHAAAKGWRVCLLGKYAPRAQRLLGEVLPALNVVYADDAPDSPKHEDALAAAVAQARPDLVLAGWDVGRDALWLARNAPRLHAKLLVGIGDTLITLADATPQPPTWAQEWGVDGLVGVLQQPRLWRVLWDAPRFVWHVLTDRNKCYAETVG